MPRRKSTETERLAAILDRLRSAYPGVRPGLNHTSPWELLVATVLSAQCTDDRVNKETPRLFARFPTPDDLAGAETAEVEALIRSIGLFRTKARSLVGLARVIVDRHGGRVPRDRAALEALPGVGRKTASVVLGQAFAVPAFAVDTHVGRVCWRLGFAAHREPREVEDAVTALTPPETWVEAHLLLIRHGRVTCTARSPRCPVCPVQELCPWPDKG